MTRAPMHRMAYEELVRRMPPEVDHVNAGLHRALHRPPVALDELHSLAEQITATGKWTPDGVRDQLVSHIRAKIAPAVNEHRMDIAAAKDIAAAQRAALGRRQIDRADVVGEMQRAEIRAYLRTLPSNDRVQAALLADAAIRDAILTSPAALSGLDDEVYARVREAAIEAEQRGELRVVNDLDAAIVVAEAMMAIVENEVVARIGDAKALAVD